MAIVVVIFNFQGWIMNFVIKKIDSSFYNLISFPIYHVRKIKTRVGFSQVKIVPSSTNSRLASLATSP